MVIGFAAVLRLLSRCQLRFGAAKQAICLCLDGREQLCLFHLHVETVCVSRVVAPERNPNYAEC